MELDLSKIIKLDFPEDRYYKEEFDKKQIYLHHTASGKGVTGDWKHFLSLKYRISTPVIIGDDAIYQLFSSKYWAHHLGVKGIVFRSRDLVNINKTLNKQSIAIEIDNWGQIAREENTYRTWAGTTIPEDEVIFYPDGFKVYKGSNNIDLPNYFDKKRYTGETCHYYQKYTDNQIEFTRQLLMFWNNRYDIPLDYNQDIWGVTNRALKGEAGIYTHNSVRQDKADIHPQPEIITMLKELNN